MDIELEVRNIRNQLQKFALPIIRLKPRPQNAENIWSSKFGGKPYWPKNMSYPETESGNKLILIAQLNFEELPQLEGFPHTGILQFFIANNQYYGMDIDRSVEEIISSHDGYQVIYHPVIDNNQSHLTQDLPQAEPENYLPLSREHRLIATLDREIPSPEDFRYEKYVGDPFEHGDELGHFLYDNLSSEGSKVGGYAHFTQEDPRIYGRYDDWVLLFQMDSEYLSDVDITWGDLGVCNFFIEKDALRNRDFSRVWYNWDCY
ncbi:Uncharacterized protein YwqG [Vibrio xiamenensis]|uniref:Uncharacterized protein YwqG n=1 Tax=Vibrio xiamenensis TaxID=861298 RepID=A0A1G8HEH4_9VIBR|nr:YwqG family protein [Vibrio xiamenensis]SDI05012.1 Uncharacterized protein YwqG [Vibrio xiamenensis]